MIRANLKSGAQGVVGTLTPISSGDLTIPGSAGAQAVSIVAINRNSGSYTQYIEPKANEYDSIILQASAPASAQNTYGGIIVPKSNSDLVMSYSFNGPTSDAEIHYTITP